jgi:hypothetical protein
VIISGLDVTQRAKTTRDKLAVVIALRGIQKSVRSTNGEFQIEPSMAQTTWVSGEGKWEFVAILRQ